jgi:hypothetical protein
LQALTARRVLLLCVFSTAAEGDSKGSKALEVLSVLPVLMGAAFTQNNINSVVRQQRW